MRAVEIRVTGDADDGRRALRGTEADLRSLEKTAKATDGGMKGIGGTLAKIGGALLAAGALRKGVDLLRESVTLASDFAETSSKIGVVFGPNAAGITQWAKTSSAALVSTEKSVLDVVAGFNILLGNKGVTGQQGRKMSKTLTDLSADLASFFNTDVSQAAQALTSALKGEMDPIEAYGVSLDEATLKAKALELGLYNGKGALSGQAKAMASYAAILEQTAAAQGDLERTQGGAANQLRQFTTNIDELKTTAGQAFLPLIEKYLPAINDWLTDLNSEDGARKLGEQFLQIGDRVQEVWPRIQTFFTDVKTQFGTAVNSDEIKGTFDALGDAAETMAGWVKTVFDAFADLSPEAKKNIALIVAAGAAIGLAKRNPIVKIGVDLVAGTIQSMAETMATAIASRMFNNAFAQRVLVTNWPPSAFAGGGGTGGTFVGGGGGKLGGFLGAVTTIAVAVTGLKLSYDLISKSVQDQQEAFNTADLDYRASLKAMDARISGVDPVLDRLASTDKAAAQALEAELQARSLGDMRVLDSSYRALTTERRALEADITAAKRESVARDKALAKLVSALSATRIEDLADDAARRKAIADRRTPTSSRSVTVNNYYPKPERASDNLAMSLRVARAMGLD